MLFSAELEDLYHGNDPEDPEREGQLIRKATDAIRTNEVINYPDDLNKEKGFGG